MSNDGSVYIYALVGGITSLVAAVRSHRTYRSIENHPTSKASSAAQGLCELQGFAWPSGVGFKNFDGEELIYYGFQIQKYVTKGSGKNKRSYWETQFSRVIQTPFYLVDATGLVEIHTDSSVVNQELDAKNKFSRLFKNIIKWSPKATEGYTAAPKIRNWKSLSKAEKNYLMANVIIQGPAGFPPSEDFWGIGSGSFRIVESVVKVGSPLFAKGYFSTQSQELPSQKLLGLTEFARHVFDKGSRSLKKMDHLLDKDRDGKIEEKEIREGYSGFAAPIRAKALQQNNIDLENSLPVFGKIGSSDDFTMLLYTLHQDQIVTILKKKFFLSAALGLLLLTFSIGDVARKVVPAVQQNYSREAEMKERAILEEIKHRDFIQKQIQKSQVPEETVKPENSIVKVENSSVKSQVLSGSEIRQLHNDCVNRLLESSCRRLLGQAEQLRLPANYRTYYKSVLCKLGKEPNCSN